jgi:hypothetical protein
MSPVVPAPPLVEIVRVELVGPVIVKPNAPLPPITVLSILIVPWPVFVKLHVTVPPTGTVNEAGEPDEQLEPVSAQPVGIPLSLTL